VGLIVLMLMGAVLQLYLTMLPSGDHQQPTVLAAGSGSVAIGGSAQGQIKTHSTGGGAPAEAPNQGVTAGGPGAVAIGGDSDCSIETDAGEITEIRR
jgi:hypothetical protein